MRWGGVGGYRRKGQWSRGEAKGRGLGVEGVGEGWLDGDGVEGRR